MKPFALSKDHRVSSDTLNWKLQERVAAGKGTYTWKPVGYYTHLDELMRAYRSRFERTSRGTLPQILAKSKQAADHAWDAVDRLIKRYPELNSVRGDDA